MSNPKNELTEKRRGSQNDEPLNNHLKCESIEPMNMMDLNDDCLDHILRKLNHFDLLSVADTSKRLMQAAQLAFKSKYRKHLVVLRNDRIIYSSAACISFGDVGAWLKVIRCFGQSISKMILSYSDMSERQCVEIDRYIKEYRVSFLTELTVRGPWTVEPMIEKITFLAEISKIMPNLRALSLDFCDSIKFIAVPFVQLDHLDVRVGDDRLKNLKNFEICSRLNPQLKSLILCGSRIDLQLLGITSECAQLKSLTLYGKIYDFIANTIADPIQFKNVTKFTTDGEFLDALVSSKASISFDHLKELEIDDGRKETYLLDFLSKHPSISKFKYTTTISGEILSDLAKVLPSVTEALIWWDPFSVDVAIDFVNECKLLKKFVFNVAKRSEYDDLQKRFGKEWRLSIKKSDYYEEEDSIEVTLER